MIILNLGYKRRGIFMLNTGETFADRYELLRQLGRGGFSEVWLAQDKLTGIQVAVKVYAPGTGLDDAGISLFTQEFSLVFDMNHTNLLHPTYYDCWERMPYLILPYCKNGSVFGYVASDIKITEAECWHILHDVAEGLAYLHGKTPPIIHQDIKPDNILINDEHDYMITDFGISARVRSSLHRNQGFNTSGGTLAYMGPERFGPSPAPIMASDIWSLGATMYELMTGMPPYGEHGGMLQKQGADIPLIDEPFSQQLKDIVYKCIALNPWDRPTAAQVADYAGQYMAGGLPAKQPEPTPAVKKPWVSLQSLVRKIEIHWDKKKMIPAAAVACVLVIVMTVLLGIDWKKDDAVPPAAGYVPDIYYDSLCLARIGQGRSYRLRGDTLIYPVLRIDSFFEDAYIHALKIYRVAMADYGDSISPKIRKDAEKEIQKVEIELYKAYDLFKGKVDTLRTLKGADQSLVDSLEQRALKIKEYIDIKETAAYENEDVY